MARQSTRVGPWQRAFVCVCLALYAAHLSNLHPEEEDFVGNIQADGRDPLEGACSIAVEVDLACDRFVREYLGVRPVILRFSPSSDLFNQAFSNISSRTAMEMEHGDLLVRMSTANSYTGRQWTEMSVREYVREHLNLDPSKMGNETFYLFGSTHGAAWEAFLNQYLPPTLQYPSESFPERTCAPDRLAKYTASSTTLSFGIAGRGTGVPFHFHGPGFLQQLHGRKRWFLYPPETTPEFHPDQSTLHWVRIVYPSMAAPPTHDCVLEPGDVIYFPRAWVHATLNLSPFTVFMATFA
ncbi:unnamed protein product [Aphanomyces euteiches]|uniref:JmjC domain-containing protein n=1 Tax=Aphanomyces euteiches TaxID=100861 RepID=A0A6G0WPW8_9STRA|nr:hypothetical protein Ae201684_012958 [Aphanomyces euteiches]KAH9097815.1 hypothetical protein Ae201684P_001290 [Aphanomyces euteiches]KAH9152417.1 hypothetical protein AeRB84_005161 [Aphanomyces euteiches]